MPNSTPIIDGMDCDTKEIYEVKKNLYGHITWSTKYPDDLEDAAENEETARYAIVVRYRKIFFSREKMEMDSIIIQSPLLKQVLNKVMKGYPGVTTSLWRLEFKSPFSPFVHRWIHLLQAIDSENDEDTKAHLVLLQKILQLELKDVIEARIDYINFGLYFSRVAYYTSKYGAGHLYRVYCQMVNRDGEKFGFDLVHYDIPEFLGTAEIDTLPIFPLESHPDEKKIKAELYKRGKLFENIVVITSDITSPLRLVKILNVADKNPTCSVIKTLASEHLIICSPLLKGYALREELWLEFLVDVPTDIAWSNSAFQSLVLPPPPKDLIHAIATSQTSNSSNFDDVINGKSKSTIFLFSNGPGIGESWTPESVAEKMQVPLYMLSVGDLGTESKDVESTLRSVLQMDTSWNAVVLLTECDAFLEARTTNSPERNKIVLIFLRKFECWEGILFMSTNLVKHLDPAFKSRIDFSADYEDWIRKLERKFEQTFCRVERIKNIIIKSLMLRLANWRTQKSMEDKLKTV
ncbi:hypothetical protein EAF00_010954 [Botryotinia globosa]|nr:hypothetical protein EAF00_010954 [Botryotinia globosa]